MLVSLSRSCGHDCMYVGFLSINVINDLHISDFDSNIICFTVFFSM